MKRCGKSAAFVVRDMPNLAVSVKLTPRCHGQHVAGAGGAFAGSWLVWLALSRRWCACGLALRFVCGGRTGCSRSRAGAAGCQAPARSGQAKLLRPMRWRRVSRPMPSSALFRWVKMPRTLMHGAGGLDGGNGWPVSPGGVRHGFKQAPAARSGGRWWAGQMVWFSDTSGVALAACPAFQ